MISIGTARMLLVGISLSAFLGCGGGDDDGGAGGNTAATITEADVTAAYQNYKTSGFTQVSLMPMASQHGLATGGVVVWTQTGFADEYKAITPGGSAGPFDAGVIVIKEHYDSSMMPDGTALVMAKFDPGYAPDTGDWFWGRYEADGSLAFGGPSGQVQFCINCHQANGFESTDWLGGLPDTNK